MSDGPGGAQVICVWVGTRYCPKSYRGIWLLIASKLHRLHGLNHFSQLRVLFLCVQVQYADIPPSQLKSFSTKAIEAARRCTWALTLLQKQPR